MQLTHDSHHSNTHNKEIIILCDHINSPANQGAIFRLADAFGAREIQFIGAPIDIQSARLKKTARSTQQHIAYNNYESATTQLKRLQEDGYFCLALEITDASIPISHLQIPHNKIVLLLGNEQEGVSKDLLKEVDKAMHIPMYGQNSSMNVAQAAAIALYHICQ